MDEKQLQFLYNEYAKGKGFKDYSEFKGLMSSEGSRKLFFDDANTELGFKDYNEFNDLLGLKKKDQQEILPSVSFPTKSQLDLPNFEKGKAFAERGFLMKGEGTKEQKRISVEPSFFGTPEVKILEEGEDPSALAEISGAVAKGALQGKVANILSAGKRPTEDELGEIAQLQSDAQLFPQSKSEKVYQEKGLKGLFKESPLLGAQFVAETMASSLSALFEASKKTVPAAALAGAAVGAPTGVGALVGAGYGLLAGQSAAGYNLSTSQDILNSLSENGVDVSNKESLIKAFSDETKMAKIRNTAAKYGVPILIFDAATAGLAGKLAAGAIGKSLSKKLLAGLGETGIQIAGGSGGELSGQLASGKKVNWDEIVVEGLAEVPGGATEVITGVAIERSKSSSNNKTLATQIATQGVQNGSEDAIVNLNRDLSNNVITPKQHQEGVDFVQKASQVADKIPENVTGENKVKSIELLVERNDIKDNNQNLIQQKQASDEAYHAGIDDEIKANEEKIKKIDSEVYGISKKPSTGSKKYVVDGKEVSQEEFDLLQGKPIGTKEIIEVKPVETYEDKVKEILMNQMKAEGYKYRGDPSDLAKIPIEDVKSDVSEALKSFIKTTDGLPIRTVYRLRAEFEAKGYGDIPDGTKLEDIKDKIDSLKPSKKRLLEDDIYRKRKEELDSLSLLPMIPEDEMTPADKKKKQDRREDIKKINDKYDAELAAVEIKEEVKPTETKASPLKDIEGLKGEQGNIRTEASRKIVNAVRSLEGFEPYAGPLDGLYSALKEADEYHANSIFSKLNNLDKAVEVVKNLPSYKGFMAKQAKAEAAPIVKAEVKPTEVKELEKEYNNKSVDELIALKKKLYPSPDIESPMTPEEKLLDRVIAKKFSEKQQEIISKRKAAEKAPTKELAEGEEVTFNTPEGKKLTGEKIIIPGFEKIDMIMVKEGLNNTVYDLASGMPISEGDFTKEGTIKSIKDNFEARNITQGKLYGQIYKGSNISSFENKSGVRQINPSSMFESYSEKRKAFDKAEYEKLPLKYTPKEIEDLNKLKDKAKENELDAIVAEIEEKTKERAKEGSYKPTYEFFDRAINKGIKEKTKKEAEKNKSPYPKEYIEPIKGTEESLAKVMMSGKKDKLSQVNPDVRKAIVDAWGKYADLYNKYGYKFSESMDEFVTSLLRYSGTLTSRENREEKLAIEQKRLKSSIEEMGKVYDKEFGKKAEVKTYNAKDLKENPKALSGDDSYRTLGYPESFASLSTNMLGLKGEGLENAKVGDVINIFKKDYVIEGFMENKNNPNETKVKLIRVNKDGNLLREKDLSKKEQKEELAQEFEEEDIEVEEQITKDDIKKAEAKFAAAEDRFKKARNKIEATQVKQAGMFGGEQKGMFAMGGEEAKSTLNPLRKAAKEAKAELDNVRNRIKVQEAAQPELKPIEKSGLTPKEIRQKESEIAKDYYKTFPIGKIKDGSIFTDTKDTYSTFKFEIERQGKQVASETVSQIKKWAESKGLEYTGTSKEDIRKTIDFKLPFKESPYQQALKEKQEADKKQNRQIGAEKAAATKEIFRKVKQMDAPADAEQIALRYLADGGKVSKEAIDEAYGSVKRAQLNTGRRELLSEEVKSKDFVQGNETLDETAHRLWEENNQRVSEIDIKNSLMAEIGNNNTRLEAAEAYLDNYNEEYKQEKEELRLAEQYKEEYLEEQEKIEKELREPLSEQIEGEASEEHINNLIDQYEAEIKGEDQQFGPASEGEVNKEASKGKVSEKAREAELAKEFKEATKKAGKKAKENAKKDYVDRNFEYIKEKIKIEKKCPT